MKSMIKGLIFGLVLGNALLTSASAQGPVKTLPDPNLCICFDQPAPTLAEANAMKLEVFFDKNLSTTTMQQCAAINGDATMFSCYFNLPSQYQTVGIHTVEWRTGNLEADDTISWNTTTTVTYEVTAKRGAPGQPVNIKIIKKTVTPVP